MKLGIMQPYFLPYIGYWQLLNLVDLYVIYDDVNYIKGGWINRNRILMNNEAKYINIKMENASSNKLINEIKVSSDKIFKNKTLKTIEHCYKKAPFFDDIFPILQKIINYQEENLAIYIENSLELISKYLGIDAKFVRSSSLNKNNDLRGQDKVIAICKELNATEYVNPIGGKELYCSKDFENEMIKLQFIKSLSVKYEQFSNDFIENLSIIDVMMFNPIKEIHQMLNCFTLK